MRRRMGRIVVFWRIRKMLTSRPRASSFYAVFRAVLARSIVLNAVVGQIIFTARFEHQYHNAYSAKRYAL
jgi:hypothetical protein